MKIKQQTSTTLIIHNHFSLKDFVSGVLGLLFCCGGAYFFSHLSLPKTHTLNCTRSGIVKQTVSPPNPANCSIRETAFFFSEFETNYFFVNELQSVIVASNSTDGDSRDIVYLRDRSSDSPFYEYTSSSDGDANEDAGKIRAFIANPQQQTFTLQQSKPFQWGVMIPVVVFLIIAIAIPITFILFTSVTFSFEKPGNKFKIRRIGLFINNTEIYSLHEIQGVELDKQSRTSGDDTYDYYTVFLEMTAGSRIIVSQASMCFNTQNQLTQSIRSFLKN
jgi:hypothetical protein